MLKTTDKDKGKINLSSRQQILYLLSKTQVNNDFILEESDDEIKTNYSWFNYFKERQEKIKNKIPKSTQVYRQKQHKLSQKEYLLIRKNIYIERKREVFYEDDAYVCTCEKPKKSLYVDNWNESVNQ